MGSDRNKHDPPGKHEGHAEDDTNYVVSTPNHLEHNNQNNQEGHETYPPQLRLKPSGMIPVPHPFPDPSEASEKSSSLPVSPLLPPRKDNIAGPILSMNTVCPENPWKCLCAPIKKNGGFEPVEELEMREGMGLMRGAESPCQEFGRGTGNGEV